MGSHKKIEKSLSVFAGLVPYLHVTAKSGERKDKMNKKLILTFGAILAAGTLMARPGFGGPRGGFGHHGGFSRGPAPMMHHRPAPMPHHYHHHSGWGHGGRHFWPGFVGGVVGGVLTDAIIGPRVITTPVVAAPVVTTAPVVATPVYTTQQVWVPGTYVDQLQPNGTVVRIWQPGHYESRQILVQ